MTQDHEKARELIACGAADLEGAEQTWLRSHLEGCESCREYAVSAEKLVRSMRAVPVAADRTLVRTTQLRVRARARELRQRQERMVFVAICCAVVAISSVITTPLIWQGFEWLGRWNRLPNPVWQVAFVLFWIAPTMAASLLFVAHGTHLSSNGTSRG